MTKSTYRVEDYGADGESCAPDPTHLPSLAAARREVRHRLGVQSLRAERRWSGIGGCDGDPEWAPVEAYHDRTRSQQHAIGCGGVVILRARS